MTKRNTYKKVEYIIKHNIVAQTLYKFFFSLIFRIISFFTPIDKKMILFSSFSGKKFNDSPKTIYDEMKSNGLLKEYRAVWAFDDPKKFSNYDLNTVKINSFKYFLTAFKAKYWITNVNIERGLCFKKSKQVYLNTWHGTGPKSVGAAASGRKDYNFKKVNYLCADGEYLKNIFIRDFDANGANVLLCGRPREDCLYHYDADLEKTIRNKYNITKEDFVILYAPTWREPKNKNANSVFNLTLNINKILKAIPNAKILFRAHSITNEISSNYDFDERFISVTDEPDISLLFFVSDVLITDFSSATFDFNILQRPFICFAPDYNEYVKERSLYFELDREYPFGVQTTTEEVINVLENIINGNDKKAEFKELKQKYNPYGGNATKVCIEKLFGVD